jgi:hypothetical protein
MSNRNFVKGECRQCGGHLEFSTGDAGETIPCPHCGQPTELAAPILAGKNNAFRRRLAIAVAILVAAAVPSAMLLSGKKNSGAISPTPPIPTVISNATAVQTNLPVEEQTNDFAILPFKLEKTPGSSLVYVTGTIRNLSSRQRFGVKVEFGLFDTNDTAIGTATDYQSVFDPNGDWHFKALVMESKAASVRFNSILEDR